MYTNHYPALGITTYDTLSRIVSYGPVRSVYEWSRDVFRSYSGMDPAEDYDTKHAKNAIGMQIAQQNGNTLEQRIAYELQDAPWKTTFVQGHEEAHALHAEGRHGKLLSAIAKQGVQLNYAPGSYWTTSTADKEYLAHMGGLYALQRQGYDVRKYGPALVKAYGSPQLAEAVDAFISAMDAEAHEGRLEQTVPSGIDAVVQSLQAYFSEAALHQIYERFTAMAHHYSAEYAKEDI